MIPGVVVFVNWVPRSLNKQTIGQPTILNDMLVDTRYLSFSFFSKTHQ